MMMTTNELKVSLPNDTDVLWERTFDAPAALVFECLTKPEHIQHWMANYGYKVESTADLRKGGAYRNSFTIESGENFALYGEYRELSPPNRIVFTESMVDTSSTVPEEWQLPASVNVVTLEERDGRTYLTMVSTYASKELRDAALATGMAEGAGVSYDQLDVYLRTIA
jgi:uncharacterized protein YndB with AHSA1/START domain